MSRVRINPDDVVNSDDLDLVNSDIDPNYDDGAPPYEPLDFDDDFEEDELDEDFDDLGIDIEGDRDDAADR